MARRTNWGKMLEPGWHLPDVAPETTPQPFRYAGEEGGKTMIANTTRILILALLIALSWAGCKRPQPFVQTGPPTVTVAKPGREPVAPSIDLTGTVAPYQTVDLVARVQGFLETISFKDGSFVNKDAVLFQIEKDMYEEKVALYQAQLNGAQAEYTRQVGMLKQNATSQANVDKALSDRDQAAANLAMAKIQLGYTTVRSPFDGRIGTPSRRCR